MPNPDLSQAPTNSLIRELVAREDVYVEGGLLSGEVYTLAAKWLPIICTDAIAIRKNNGAVEGTIIRRGTGYEPYRGKFALIGGSILRDEHIEDALRRHFRTDIGLEINFCDPAGWRRPAMIVQYKPYDRAQGELPDFNHEPRKHAISLAYLVTLADEKAKPHFGKTPFGQEAEGLFWFSRGDCPPSEDFGYDTHRTFLQLLEKADKFF